MKRWVVALLLGFSVATGAQAACADHPLDPRRSFRWSAAGEARREGVPEIPEPDDGSLNEGLQGRRNATQTENQQGGVPDSSRGNSYSPRWTTP